MGAGSAGCVLANRLSADPACRVALLEAGGPDRAREIRIPVAFTKLFQTAYDWNYRTTRQPQLSDRELYWPRGKTLGGSSSINGQAWTRGHRLDYDGWAEDCPGWSYEEVLPYFQRAEHRVGSNAGGVYGTSGPQFISELRDPNPTTAAFLAACAELGMRRLGELNEPDNTGFSPTPVTQRRGLRHSAADAYLRPVRRRPNLTVVTGAHVQRILFDGTRATGVEYRDAAGATQRVTVSGEVILSGGAINSPQLLMLSGIGDPEQLRAVGVEPRHAAGGRRCEPAGPPGLRRRRALPEAGHPLRGRLPGPAGPVPARASRHAHLQHQRGGRLCPQRPSSGRSRSRAGLASGAAAGRGSDPPTGPRCDLGGGAAATGQPRSTSVLPAPTRRSRRSSTLGYLTAESDLRGLVAGMRIAERVCDTAALRPYVGAPMAPWPGTVDDATLATLIRENAATAFHPVGTCRMGSDDAAVVDCELRVRGLDGLRVVDASIMPRITRGHTHAPTVMIAERAADLIRATNHGPEPGTGRRARVG